MARASDARDDEFRRALSQIDLRWGSDAAVTMLRERASLIDADIRTVFTIAVAALNECDRLRAEVAGLKDRFAADNEREPGAATDAA